MFDFFFFIDEVLEIFINVYKFMNFQEYRAKHVYKYFHNDKA